MNHMFAKSVDAIDMPRCAYTVGTLVTRPDEYEQMTTAFVEAGFSPDDCEFLFVDNSGPANCDAYTALNRVLNRASGEFVILCHQDVRPIDRREKLDRTLRQLGDVDPHWAVAGNAGGTAPGRLALRITDPHGRDSRVGDLPARVQTLDENFLVVRRDARVGFSRDIEGFHFYGTDISLNADIAGHSVYVIDYHLEHLSPGRKDRTFARMQDAFRKKWSHALRPRWLQTPCALVRVSGDRVDHALSRIAERPFARLVRRLPGASGWRRSA